MTVFPTVIRRLERMDNQSLSEHSIAAADLLSAMANPKRLMILCTLVDTEVPVGVLASQVGLSQSALSQHLSKLRAQRLVKTRRDAQTIYYSSNSESVKKILASLEEIYCQAQKSSKTAA
ncbi:DNA-binding transcriptional ArsR family regulator [Agrobacterium pusense]|jgi:DNA-binding transcriptional ArsR family regulator|nr:DNA-binding transcriptional ArsR family regulator [Rhizobium sp. RAS22]MDP9774262.1 DNA-binding transcriptional ArsR family regulator [Rhizobium sp. SORGH_AS_0755]MDR6190226.1 DNA-binding transcriptional ArsR family regulator [Agrobacterium pusense]